MRSEDGGQPQNGGGNTAQQAGLGRVGRHDIRLEFAEGPDDFQQRQQVLDGRNRAGQALDRETRNPP